MLNSCSLLLDFWFNIFVTTGGFGGCFRGFRTILGSPEMAAWLLLEKREGKLVAGLFGRLPMNFLW